jgi:hypothetical protein
MNILPPEPPNETKELNGTFKYIKSDSDQKMFSTAYKAITMTENWDYIKKMESCFGPESDCIYNKIEELGYDGHSGASFSYTLQSMKYISLNGEENFKNNYFDNERKAKNNIDIQNRRKLLKILQEE